MLHAIRSLSDAVYSRMSSAAGFPVPRTPAPGNEKLPPTSAISGLTANVCLATYDPASHCLKTSQACLLLSEGDSSTESLATWPRFGTLVNGRLYQQAPLEHHTGGSGSGCSAGMSWPTARVTTNSGIPNRSAMGREFQDVYADSRLEDVVGWIASNGQPSPDSGPADRASRSTDGSQAGLWLTPRANEPTNDTNFVARMGDRTDKCFGSLNQQVAAKENWATPQASDPAHAGPNQRDSSGRPALPAQVGLWASPQSRDYRTSEGNEARWENPERSRNLNDQTKHVQGSGKLNPHWVFTLMGYPPLWAELGRKFTTGSRS